jgi:hypothetical protein
VISDWNGYRDTVRDGVDGFRIPTLMPPAPAGDWLAARHADGADTYDRYIGLASMSVAVDIAACAEAYHRLASDASLRHTLGAAARKQARVEFDWAVIIGRYQALWAELAERRAAAGAAMPEIRSDPRRADPFWLFEGYPTRVLAPTDRLVLAPGASPAVAAQWRATTLVAIGTENLASAELTDAVLDTLARRGRCAVADLLALARSEEGAAALLRTLGWLCKLDLLRLADGRSRQVGAVEP